MKKICLLTVSMILTIYAFGQAPSIKGKLYISIQEGTIDANLSYQNIPIENFSFLLNSGLNIAYMKDSNGNILQLDKQYDKNNYESFEYKPYPVNKKDSLSSTSDNSSFTINYAGKFPVLKDSSEFSQRGDWKGNIALNGTSIRATEQSAWYPIIFDKDHDKLYNDVSYDLEIICKDCESIYLNGSPIANQKEGHFQSKTPRPLFLFAGNFTVNEQNNIALLNIDLSQARQQTLINETKNIISNYAKTYDIPYTESIKYIYTTPVSLKNNWAFVSFPSIVFVNPKNFGLANFFEPNSEKLKPTFTYFICHELGHYYFGNLFIPNADLRWFFLEGMTEYISLNQIKALYGENAYQEKLDGYLKRIESLTVIPLSKIKDDQFDEAYKYYYNPLLLTVLEHKIGKKAMDKWIISLLKTDQTKLKTDYAFLKKSLQKINLKEFESFENEYINADNAKDKVIEFFKDK